jgi:hypothetical protein
VKESEGNTLYRISPELSCELVASSRRRPAVNPLDSTLAGDPFSVSPSRDGGVIIGIWGKQVCFLNSVSGAAPEGLHSPYIGNLRVTSIPGLLLHTKHQGGDRHGLVRAEFLDAEGDELLLLHPSERGDSGRARFQFPKELESLPASNYIGTWRDDGLDILGWASRNSPWGASDAWLVRVDAQGGSMQRLRFAWPAGSDERARAALHSPNAFRYPLCDPKCLIATDQGLVITGRGMAGFWFIPKEDLDARRKGMRVTEGK